MKTRMHIQSEQHFNPRGADLITLCRQALRLCRVESDQLVVIMGDPRSRQSYIDVLFQAARDLTASVLTVVVPHAPPTPRPGDDVLFIDEAVALLKQADLVVDLTTTGWLYTPSHAEVLSSGTRTLLINDEVDTLARLFPTPGVQHSARTGADLLSRAREAHVTSSLGTDLRLKFDNERPAGHLCGISDVAGRWDHWPQGSVFRFPSADGAHGRLVLGPGDQLMGGPIRRHVVGQVECQVEEGRIVDIQGGLDAALLQHYFGQVDDSRNTQISHVGWGVDSRGDWTRLGMDHELCLGSVMVAFGKNNFPLLGGANDAPRHLHFASMAWSFWIDDQQVVDAGSLLVEPEEASR